MSVEDDIDITYQGIEPDDIPKPPSKRQEHSSFTAESMYKIPLVFDDILHPERLNIAALVNSPTFIAWKLGLSDRFLDEALLPKVRDTIPRPAILMPLERHISLSGLAGQVAIRPLIQIEEPTLVGQVALRAYDKFSSWNNPKLKKFIRSRRSFMQHDRAFNLNGLLKKRKQTTIPNNLRDELENKIKEISIHIDPLFLPDILLTVFQSKGQSDCAEMVRRIITKLESQEISFYNRHLIVLIEVFGQFESNLITEIYNLMREGTERGITLWLHATISNIQRDLLDQFHNHIVISPSRSELATLSHTQSFKSADRRILEQSRNVAIVSSLRNRSSSFWQLIPLLETHDLFLEEGLAMSNLDPVAMSILTKAVDFLFDQAAKTIEEIRSSRKSRGENIPSTETIQDLTEQKEEVFSKQPKQIHLRDISKEVGNCIDMIHSYRDNRRRLNKSVSAYGGFDFTPQHIQRQLQEAEDQIVVWSKKLKDIIEESYGHKIIIIGLD